MTGYSAALTPLEPKMIPLLVLLGIPACMFVSKASLPERPDTSGDGGLGGQGGAGDEGGAGDDGSSSRDDTGPPDDSDPPLPTWYADADADGYGNPAQPTTSQAAPEGYVANSSDCDDTDATRYPGAEEICEDGVMNDCAAEEGTVGCPVSGTVDLATEAGALLVGTKPGKYAGQGGLGSADIDGDGDDDLVVAAPYTVSGDDPEGAQIYLVAAPLSGEIALDDSVPSLTAARAGKVWGWTLGSAGDLDEDGYDDLATGTASVDTEILLGPFMSSRDLDEEGVDVEIAGGAYALDAGLLNEDDTPDLVASLCSTASGAAVVLGPISTAFSLLDDANAVLSGSGCGTSIAVVGDLNGDGVGEVATGAQITSTSPNKAEIYVVEGPFGDTNLEDADVQILPEDLDLAYTWSGYYFPALARAGDVDGDGTDDLYFGLSHVNDIAGAVYLFHGGTEGDLEAEGTLEAENADMKLGCEEAYNLCGKSIDGPGDLDGDGLADLLLGAGVTLESGQVIGAMLIAGGASGTLTREDANAIFVDAGSGIYYSVAGSGDNDGDGTPDLLLGAPYYGTGGGAWWVSGASGAL